MRPKCLLAILGFVPLFLLAAQQAVAQDTKEYTPKNKRFTIQMPLGQKSGQRTQVITINKSKIPIEVGYADVKNGPQYTAASIGIPALVMRDIPADRRFDTFRDLILKPMKGKVTDEKDLMQGKLSGKDYQIDAAKGPVRMQMYMQGGFVFYAIVEAKTKEDVTSKRSNDFFASFKMTPDVAEGKTGGDTAKTKAGGDTGSNGGATKIVGGGFDPEFKDEAPDGSLLIGFEFGMGKFVNKDNIKAIRPIYRSATGAEVMGKQIGTNLTRVVTVKAKAGYAVGGLSVNAGLWLDGVTITFMKVNGAQLDTTDAYTSDLIGSKGGTASALAGTGTPVIGIVGKSNKEGSTGIGLVLKK